MKNRFFLPILTLVLGAIGFGLHYLDRINAYDVETSLTDTSSVFVTALIAVTEIALILFLIFALRTGKEKSVTYAQAFGTKKFFPDALQVVAGVILLGASAMTLLTIGEAFRLPSMTLVVRILKPVLALTGVGSGIVLILSPMRSRDMRKDPKKGVRRVSLLLPPVMCFFWLIVQYMDSAANADELSFVFGRTACIAAMLAFYYISSFSFEYAKIRRAKFFLCAGTYLCFTSAADTVDFGLRLFSIGSMIALFAALLCLCANEAAGFKENSIVQEVTENA